MQLLLFLLPHLPLTVKIRHRSTRRHRQSVERKQDVMINTCALHPQQTSMKPTSTDTTTRKESIATALQQQQEQERCLWQHVGEQMNRKQTMKLRSTPWLSQRQRRRRRRRRVAQWWLVVVAVSNALAHHHLFSAFTPTNANAFLRSFVPSFLRSFVRSFVPSFVRSFVPSFVPLFAPSSVCSFAVVCVWMLVVGH